MFGTILRDRSVQHSLRPKKKGFRISDRVRCISEKNTEIIQIGKDLLRRIEDFLIASVGQANVIKLKGQQKKLKLGDVVLQKWGIFSIFGRRHLPRFSFYIDIFI